MGEAEHLQQTHTEWDRPLLERKAATVPTEAVVLAGNGGAIGRAGLQESAAGSAPVGGRFWHHDGPVLSESGRLGKRLIRTRSCAAVRVAAGGGHAGRASNATSAPSVVNCADSLPGTPARTMQSESSRAGATRRSTAARLIALAKMKKLRSLVACKSGNGIGCSAFPARTTRIESAVQPATGIAWFLLSQRCFASMYAVKLLALDFAIPVL
jgi:hypothetical protein